MSAGKLSVEWNAANANVEIVMNREGVKALIQRCEDLLADGDHIHIGSADDSGIFDGRFAELVLELRDDGWPEQALRAPIKECK